MLNFFLLLLLLAFILKLLSLDKFSDPLFFELISNIIFAAVLAKLARHYGHLHKHLLSISSSTTFIPHFTTSAELLAVTTAALHSPHLFNIMSRIMRLISSSNKDIMYANSHLSRFMRSLKVVEVVHRIKERVISSNLRLHRLLRYWPCSNNNSIKVVFHLCKSKNRQSLNHLSLEHLRSMKNVELMMR